MKVLLLISLSAVGTWYNLKAVKHWWEHQKTRLPTPSDISGWGGVALSGLWYFFVFAFLIGLTVNNTIFR